jgi:peptidoglycan hydrolase-like protein with peptidoglycan-binding domain
VVSEEDAPAPKEHPAKKHASNNVLFKRGDAGAHVKKMQECLSLLGCDCPETGRFCAATESALKEAQKQSGLEVTGKLDEATCAAICK